VERPCLWELLYTSPVSRRILVVMQITDSVMLSIHKGLTAALSTRIHVIHPQPRPTCDTSQPKRDWLLTYRLWFSSNIPHHRRQTGNKASRNVCPRHISINLKLRHCEVNLSKRLQKDHTQSTTQAPETALTFSSVCAVRSGTIECDLQLFTSHVHFKEVTNLTIDLT